MQQKDLFADELMRAHMHTCMPKADGSAVFVSDIKWPGTLEGVIVRAPVPRCRILKIDVSAARNMDGVHAVVTAGDIPGENRIGKTVMDQPILCDEETYGAYDAVALVAAETKEQARAAAEAVDVQYVELPAVYELSEAVLPDSPRARPDMVRDSNLLREYNYSTGNADDAIAGAPVCVEHSFTLPPIEHCYLENDCAIARFNDDGSLDVRLGCHTVTYEREILAAVLNMPLDKVHVELPFMGGSFGGKDDGLIASYAALLAFYAKRSVRVYIDRDEEMVFHTKRHGQEIDVRMGFDEKGRILGTHYWVRLNTGSSSHHGENIAKFISVNACGPYRMPNVRVDTKVYYTNGVAMGAMRSWGMTGITFANECMMGMAAERLGMSQLDIRSVNAIRDGDHTLSEHLVPPCARYDECIEKVSKLPLHKDAISPRYLYGVGYAGASQGCNLHFGHNDESTVKLSVVSGGIIEIMTCANDLGQGLETTLSLIVSRVMNGYPVDRIRYCRPNTRYPEGGPSGASRQTSTTGNAAYLAAIRLKEKICAAGGPQSGPELAAWLEEKGVGMEVHASYMPPLTSAPDDNGHGYPVNQYGYDIQRAEVLVDIDTGMVRVLDLSIVCDCGTVINQTGAEGQVQGAATQGLGMALMENFMQKDGRPLQHGFSDYLFPTASDAPNISVKFIDKPADAGYIHTKGLAELAITAAAPAVIAAIHDAAGIWITDLPASPDKVLLALEKRRGEI